MEASSVCTSISSWLSRLVDQPVLPLAFAVVADMGVERGVAAKAAVHRDHVLFGHAQLLGDQCFTWSGRRSPSSRASIWLFTLRRLKNSFFWLAVVPILTSDQERRTNS